jgi:hypothetical protein
MGQESINTFGGSPRWKKKKNSKTTTTTHHHINHQSGKEYDSNS